MTKQEMLARITYLAMKKICVLRFIRIRRLMKRVDALTYSTTGGK